MVRPYGIRVAIGGVLFVHCSCFESSLAVDVIARALLNTFESGDFAFDSMTFSQSFETFPFEAVHCIEQPQNCIRFPIVRRASVIRSPLPLDKNSHLFLRSLSGNPSNVVGTFFHFPFPSASQAFGTGDLPVHAASSLSVFGARPRRGIDRGCELME
jgi:hypothetical protein